MPSLSSTTLSTSLPKARYLKPCLFRQILRQLCSSSSSYRTNNSSGRLSNNNSSSQRPWCNSVWWILWPSSPYSNSSSRSSNNSRCSLVLLCLKSCRCLVPRVTIWILRCSVRWLRNSSNSSPSSHPRLIRFLNSREFKIALQPNPTLSQSPPILP